MRVIRNAWVAEQERRPEAIAPFPAQLAKSGAEGLMFYAHDAHVDPERTCMPSGQGLGAIHEILPAGEIVRRVVAEAEAVLDGLAGLRAGPPAGTAAPTRSP